MLSSPCCKLAESGLWRWLFLKLSVYHGSPSVIVLVVQGLERSSAQQEHSLVRKKKPQKHQNSFYNCKEKIPGTSCLNLCSYPWHLWQDLKTVHENHGALIHLVWACKKSQNTGSFVFQMLSYEKWVMSHYAAVILTVVGITCCQKTWRECGCVLQQVG